MTLLCDACHAGSSDDCAVLDEWGGLALVISVSVRLELVFKTADLLEDRGGAVELYSSVLLGI